METKDRLMNIGKKGDIFEDTINRLLDIYDSKKGDYEKMKKGGLI